MLLQMIKRWLVMIASCALVILSAKDEVLVTFENITKKNYSSESRYPHFVLHLDGDILWRFQCHALRGFLFVSQKLAQIQRIGLKTSDALSCIILCKWVSEDETTVRHSRPSSAHHLIKKEEGVVHYINSKLIVYF